MKKLLTTITLSALVGTSASNLKPMFTNNVVNHGFKSNQLNNKDFLIKNQNDMNPFIPKQLPSLNQKGIGPFAVDSSGNIYAGTNDGLYKSSDGINFQQVNDKLNASVNDIAIQNTTIYVSTNNDGLWKSNDKGTFDKINEQNYIRCLAVDSSGNIYAGTTSYGLLKSTNGGNSFSRIDNNIKMDFINKIIFDNHNNIWVACDNGLYKSSDGINFEQVKGIANTFSITSIAITIDGKIYAGTKWKGLYKSTDGINFDKIDTINNSIITGILITTTKIIYISTNGDGLWKSNDKGTFDKINESPNNIMFNSLVVTSNNVVYIGTYKGNGGIWTINLIEQLIKINKPDTFDKSWPLYNGIVYNSAQKIDIKEKLVAKATLDNKSITIPTTDLDIPVGEHNLVLTLKDKALASVFGGDPNTGQVTYKLWVKTSIDKNKIDYQTKIDDTQLYTGLVSNAGNTNNAEIIQTKSKDGSSHPANLDLSINDKLIDFDVNKSFYEQGAVDSFNNFIENPSSKKTVSQNLSIQNDGIYHLHLEDTVGNTYDSYLELGESNWKLKGTFDDKNLTELANQLNVTVNESNPIKKSEAMGWLQNYKIEADKQFRNAVQINGKGFEISIDNDLKGDYKSFLDHITYVDNKTQYAINQAQLNDGIIKIAEQKLKNGLDKLAKNLNVNTSNVVNKSTLEHYTNWINNYQDFINKNKDKWINAIEKIASRGFATAEQENQIKRQVSQFLNNDNIKNYLKNIVWEDNKLLKATSSDYQQYIELDKLQTDIINWVNQNLSAINTAYQNAITQAESGLNLHGYSIDTLLNGKPKPQTKSEIDNFADGKSYHDWLQSQANIKFRGWQLVMGFGISIPLLLVVVAIAWVIRSRTNPRYNGVARARKDLRQERKQIKKIKK